MTALRLKNILGYIVTMFIVALVTHGVTGAQAASTAQGIQVSPAVVELNAAQGRAYDVKLSIVNVTTSELTYTTSVEDFGASDETGTPHIFIDKNLSETQSIRSWINVGGDLTLAPKETRDIVAKVNVPANAEPGGHYGVLRFSGQAPSVDKTGVGLSASAGVLMLIRVDGTITEKASLASLFTTGTTDGKQSSFFEEGPIFFETRIRNQGTIHVKPVGSIEIKDMFGNHVDTIQVNKEKSNVLPNSIRKFESQMGKKFMMGLYTADLALGYGTTGQAITGTVTFWVIPYKLIGAVLLGAAILIFVLIKSIKGYNKRLYNKIHNEIKNKNKQGKS